MKIFFHYILFCFVFFIAACSKENFITSPGASLLVNIDTLKFDTVFTSVGSVTKSFTIVNNNNKKIRISSIELAGRNASVFSININGIAAASVSNYEIDANDSIYVFVKTTIDPTNTNNPFLLLDSLLISYNGNNQKVYLQAYGQNARFINGGTIISNTTWNNDLPYVIKSSVVIAEGTTLTIEKGTRIFSNAKAAIVIDGTLVCNGEKKETDRIVFCGERLDEPYRNLPASWPGIVFTKTSTANKLVYTNLLNAYQALVTEDGANNITPKITLEQCVITNAYDIGLYAVNTSVVATNCLISQCGNNAIAGLGGSNLLITGSGNYSFNHCTIATYANYYQQHKQPSVFISNKKITNSSSLDALFVNCIIYGQGGDAENELAIEKNTGDKVSFFNCLYKVKDGDPDATFTGCIKNTDPQFVSISTNQQLYNFRLKDLSPAVDAGKITAANIDLDGVPRPAGSKPDIGCYEKQ